MKPEFCINCNVWFGDKAKIGACPACLQKITERVVLWLNGHASLLRNIERDNEGFIKRATVINGQYLLTFDSKKWEARAKRGRETVNKWDVTKYQELAVPDDKRDVAYGMLIEGYADILYWAAKQK